MFSVMDGFALAGLALGIAIAIPSGFTLIGFMLYRAFGNAMGIR